MRAFISPGLPPTLPVELAGLYPHLDRANQALGRLDGLTTLLPDTKFFLYPYVRKEALLSSQIEGTQSSFSNLLLFENDAEPSVPIDDVEEVSNYVAAMEHGLRRIAGGVPLSLRLIAKLTPPCCAVGEVPIQRRAKFGGRKTVLAEPVLEMPRLFRLRRSDWWNVSIALSIFSMERNRNCPFWLKRIGSRAV